PEPHRFLRRLPPGVCGEDDHLRIGTGSACAADHLQAVSLRHSQVSDDEVERGSVDGLGGAEDPLGLNDVVAGPLEQQRESGAGRFLIVDEQDRSHYPFSASTLNAGTGLSSPLRARGPTSSTSTSPSTAVATRAETRICPPLASPQRRAARFVTVP